MNTKKSRESSPQSQFGILAEYYDLLNSGVNYKKVADYIEKIFDIYNLKPEIVLDLACGTGNLALELDSRGYDMIGLDLSYEMLSSAIRKKRRGNAEKNKSRNILWTNQDMTDFELYGTVDAVVCAFDSLNYIINAEDLKKCFGLIYNYLNYGGAFIFDVNSKYKFENVYGRNDFIIESKNKNILCAWHNYYNKRTKICDFDMTFFVKEMKLGQQLYARYNEVQHERYYNIETLIKLLNEFKFEDINIFYDFDMTSCESGMNAKKEQKNKERICFACVKK